MSNIYAIINAIKEDDFMENRKYMVSRDNIYVGEVVRTDKIYRYEGDTDFFRTKSGQLDTVSWFSYRSMLFVPNEEKLSNDLLYSSPSYPILNITDDETCLALGEKSIVIIDACNLAALLEYFGYNKDLTYDDIMRIRKTFFTGRFAQDNCELFGMKGTIFRTFFGVSENVLPREYWDVLDNRGDNTLMDCILGHEKLNAFAPHKQEGSVKKLTGF